MCSTKRTPYLLNYLLILFMATALWLTGCVDLDDGADPDLPGQNISDEGGGENNSENGSNGTDPENSTNGANSTNSTNSTNSIDPINSANGNDGRTVNIDGQWSGPGGPAGGLFTQLWSAGGHYFALERNFDGSVHFWRSESGDEWFVVDLPGGIDPLEIIDVLAFDDGIYLLGPDLHRSDDGGQSWEAHQWDGLNLDYVAFARAIGDELYVVIDEFGQSPKLYLVEQDVAELIDDDLPTEPMDFIKDGDVMLLSRGSYVGEIFRKVGDDGSWESAEVPAFNPSGSPDLTGVSLHVHQGLFYATSQSGVWRSVDGGVFDEVVANRASQAVIVGDELYFGMMEPWNYLIAMSISDPTTTGTSLTYLGGLSEAGSLILATNGDSVLAALHHDGLLRMDLEAGEWEQISPTFRDIIGMASSSDREWVLTREGKIFWSAQGQNWHLRHIGSHQAMQIEAVDDALFVATRGGEFFAIRRHQGSWHQGDTVYLSQGRPADIVEHDGAVLIPFAPVTLSHRGGTTQMGGGFYRAENQGAHWTDWSQIHHGLPDLYPNRQTPPVYALLAGADLLVVAGKGGVFRSLDSGQTWQESAVEGGLAEAIIAAGRVFFAQNEEALFLVNSRLDGSVDVRRSDDDGQSWQKVSHDLTASTIPLSLYGDDSGLLMGTFADGLLGSFDGGQTWLAIGQGYTGGTITDLQVSGSILRAATARGIYELDLE